MSDSTINFVSVLGFFDFILAIAYIGLSFYLLVTRKRRLGETGIILYIFQAVIAPLCLLMCGLILMWQGLELSMPLQLAFFLLHILIIYFGVKDILIFELVSNYVGIRNHKITRRPG
ncbi:MAG: hypothetical protein QNJ54_10500 [Prochloraceae cyanobacterium]|nr:hypothetical protein [Prochloraceae cyanobacterium]